MTLPALRSTLLVLALCAAGSAFATPARAASFRTDVMAVLSKAGCNAGACHGNATGKGGLKISLRGQDPADDWAVLTREQAGRRVNLEEPARSLLLLKATGSIAHEGGTRFSPGSPEYALMLAWLQDGARDDGPSAPTVKGLRVKPVDSVLIEPVREAQLTVQAEFSDGTKRDVTRLAVYEPNTTAVKVSAEGLVTTPGPGEVTVLVRYLGQQVPVHFAFVPARPGFQWSQPPEVNEIDHAVFTKLQTLRMNPSDLCSDEVFLRRAYLDLLGILPTPIEAREFVADASADKRAKLIDHLLTRDEFAAFWALKWADLLKVEARALDQQGVKAFHGWIRDGLKANKPLDQFAREIIAARGSTFENPPANWWRANRDPVTRAENTARVFLGTQLNCAQCHNHPFERWTQDDYYDWAAVFARVDYKLSSDKSPDKFDKHAFAGDQTVLIKASGSVTNPRTGEQATAQFLGGGKPSVNKERDELLTLAEWLPHTPMFARTQVNRVWANLLGRGLVDPIDDFRASNPASYSELLETLSNEFAKGGYNLRWLIRIIMNSRVYQLSSEPNETNAADESNFSHGLIRRLSAEQLLDSASEALAAPLQIENQPAGTRLAQVPEGRKHYRPLTSEVDRFAASFGKPPRLIASDCERSNEVALPQVFQLISGPLMQKLLTQKENRVAQLAASSQPPRETVEQLYWATLSRSPSEAERARLTGYLEKAENPKRALEDVAWSLLNSKEFLFRR